MTTVHAARPRGAAPSVHSVQSLRPTGPRLPAAARALMRAFGGTLLCAGLLLTTLTALNTAQANSTLIAGARASGSGNVMVAQSVDIPGRAVSSRFLLPSQQHQSQETVSYVDGVKVPQVPHTNGLFVTLTRALQPDGRTLVRESFLNDKGVLVAQNVLPAAKRLKLSAEELATPVNGLFTDPEHAREMNAQLDIPAEPAGSETSLRYVLPSPSDYAELDRRQRTESRRTTLLKREAEAKASKVAKSEAKNDEKAGQGALKAAEDKVGQAVADAVDAALTALHLKSAPEPGAAPVPDALDALAQEPTGIVNGLGRMMAERGNSARLAVTQAVELVERFGWRGPVIEYTVADAREAWILAVFPGRTAVARRVADDEVVFTAQTSSLGDADLTDPHSTIVTDFTRKRAEALLESAREDLKSSVAPAGEAPAWPQRTVFRLEDHVDPPTDDARRKSHMREAAARKIVAPETLGQFPSDWRDFWTAPGWRGKEPLSVEKVKQVLRAHGSAHDADGICNPSTARSDVWELNRNPLLVRVTSSEHRPGESLFVPAHPLAAPLRHFSTDAPAIRFDTDSRDVRTIRQIHAVLLSLLRQDGGGVVNFEKISRDFEAKAFRDVQAAEANALFLSDRVSSEKARQRLWSTDARIQALADAVTAQHIAEIAPERVTVLADRLRPGRSTVKVVVFGSDTFDATSIVRKSLRLRLPDTDGEGYAEPNLSQATALVRRDFDGDGRTDAVVTFTVDKLLASTVPDTYLTLFVTGTAGKKSFVGFDTAIVNAAPESVLPQQ